MPEKQEAAVYVDHQRVWQGSLDQIELTADGGVKLSGSRLELALKVPAPADATLTPEEEPDAV